MKEINMEEKRKWKSSRDQKGGKKERQEKRKRSTNKWNSKQEDKKS